MKKLLLFLTITMAVFVTDLKAKSVIVGFLPQDSSARENRTNEEMAAYYSGQAVKIVRYHDYGVYDKITQKTAHMMFFKQEMQKDMAKVFGTTLSDADIVQKILNAEDEVMVGQVSANGISMDPITAKLLKVSNAITRNPYAGEHAAVIKGPYGTLKVSRMCFNFLPLILSSSTGSNFEEEVTPTTAGKDGAPGKNGINCWDLNMNGKDDPNEDFNQDGWFDVRDCQGAPGKNGINGTNGTNGTDCNCDPQPTYYGNTAPRYGYGYSRPVATGCYGCGYSESYGGYGGYTPSRNVEVNLGVELTFVKGNSGSTTNTNNNTNTVIIQKGSTKGTTKTPTTRGQILASSGGCPAGTFLFNGKCLTPGKGSTNTPPLTTTDPPTQTGSGHVGDPPDPLKGNANTNGRFKQIAQAPVVKQKNVQPVKQVVQQKVPVKQIQKQERFVPVTDPKPKSLKKIKILPIGRY